MFLYFWDLLFEILNNSLMSELHSPSKSLVHFEQAQEIIGSPELVVNNEGGACGSQHLEEGSDPLLLLLSVVLADGLPRPVGLLLLG